MKSYKVLRLRIYPDPQQTIQLDKTLGCSRAIYNKMLRIGFSLLKSGDLYRPMMENGVGKLKEKLRTYKLQALMKTILED